MNLLFIGIGHEKELIISYRYRFNFFISCIPRINVYNDLNISSSGYIFERVYILMFIACPVYLHWLTINNLF